MTPRRLAGSLPGFHLTVAYSRWVGDPTDLYRAGQEALLAANVAEAEVNRKCWLMNRRLLQGIYR